MKTFQNSPEETFLKKIPEDQIALIGTINDAADLSPLTMGKRFSDWMDEIALTIFHHKDNRSISYFYVTEKCKTSEKKHLHFILFNHGIGRETESHALRVALANELKNRYPFRSDIQINPYLSKSDTDGKDWISYITKGDCEFSGFSNNIMRKIKKHLKSINYCGRN